MSDLKMTTAGDYMSDEDYEKWTGYPNLSISSISSDSLQSATITVLESVGAWDLGGVHFNVTHRPTDEQIKNTEEFFGWKWVEGGI